MTNHEPGSAQAQLVVADIETARKEQLDRDVEAVEIRGALRRHTGTRGPVRIGRPWSRSPRGTAVQSGR
jgi:hypothetical protein